MLEVFGSQYKTESLSHKNHVGENPLFTAARTGDPKIFSWFTGHIDFFKARGERNFEGLTIEHIACKLKHLEIVEEIKARPDSRDYYGNLPIFYSIEENDADMIKKLFPNGKEYFILRNYKYQTIFHIAAKFNSLQALVAIVKRNSVFIEELIKKDYKGQTPIHMAAKYGSLDILRFYLSVVTPPFLAF